MVDFSIIFTGIMCLIPFIFGIWLVIEIIRYLRRH